MKARIWSKIDYRNTVSVIFRMAREFKRDLCEFPRLDTVRRVYDYVRALPYRDDPPGIEFVSRPAYTLWPEWTGPRDCDDKTLALGAWCNLYGFAWRVVCAGESADPALNPHHIYPEIKLDAIWTPADATYRRCELGSLLYVERFREVYTP